MKNLRIIVPDEVHRAMRLVCANEDLHYQDLITAAVLLYDAADIPRVRDLAKRYAWITPERVFEYGFARLQEALSGNDAVRRLKGEFPEWFETEG